MPLRVGLSLRLDDASLCVISFKEVCPVLPWWWMCGL